MARRALFHTDRQRGLTAFLRGAWERDKENSVKTSARVITEMAETALFSCINALACEMILKWSIKMTESRTYFIIAIRYAKPVDKPSHRLVAINLLF